MRKAHIVRDIILIFLTVILLFFFYRMHLLQTESLNKNLENIREFKKILSQTDVREDIKLFKQRRKRFKAYDKIKREEIARLMADIEKLKNMQIHTDNIGSGGVHIIKNNKRIININTSRIKQLESLLKELEHQIDTLATIGARISI